MVQKQKSDLYKPGKTILLRADCDALPIQEDKCKNIPGTTSLHISFEYNQEIINTIKKNLLTM